jgi:adenylosuccinate lyase
MAEAAMMALARSLGHERAHAAVASANNRAAASGEALRVALLDDPKLAAALDGAAVDELLDPTRYLGVAVEVASAVGQEPR